MTISARISNWLADRGLDLETAVRLGWDSGPRGAGEGLVIPSYRDGRIVARKWRLFDGTRDNPDQRWLADANGETCFWNEDVLRDTSLDGQPLIITEGHFDALAAIQCGFARTVSVPNGAPQPAAERSRKDLDDGERYRFVREIGPLLTKDRFPEIILATDGDGPGAQLLHDLALLLGRYRCKFLTYKNGEPGDKAKDLNDVLMRDGPSGVVQTINAARYVALPGLYKLSEMSPPTPQTIYELGGEGSRFRLFGENYKIRLGDFVVVTGVPGYGKTTFINDWCCEAADRYGIRIAWASFEQDPQRDHRRSLRNWYRYRPNEDVFAPVPTWQEADQWIDDHHVFIKADDETDATLDWLLEMLEGAVLRYGAKICVIDPWNEIEHRRSPGESETEYIGWAIRTMKRFARKFQVHLILIAHPAKLQREKGKFLMPTLYDISGCYSDDTEVLTARGWLRHSEVTLNDDVACFDLSGFMSYAKPTRVIRKPYSGLMERFIGYGYDLLVTPDHRMVVCPEWAEPTGTQKATGIGRPVRWKKGEWSFCNAADLPSAVFSVPLAAPLKDGANMKVGTALSALAGWYVSEGSKVSSGVSISQAVGPRSDQIAELLSLLSIPFTVHVSAPGGKGGKKPINNFYIGVRGARDLVNWLHTEAGIGSANKRIPIQILQSNRSDKLAFLAAYLDGDGCPKNKGFSACTTSIRLRDELQRLCLELGLSCSWSTLFRAPKHSQCWQVNIGHGGRCKTALRTGRNRSQEQYTGDVWCLTVPTGAYFVRRNGKALACGNSANWYNKCDLGIIVHRENADTSSVRTAKSRYREIIGKPGEVEFMFSEQTRRYTESQRLS